VPSLGGARRRRRLVNLATLVMVRRVEVGRVVQVLLVGW
jgi:hypothetical protein